MKALTRLFLHFQRADFLLMSHRTNLAVDQATAWYPDWIYETMETDEVRNREYRQVIERSVRNRVVLELGTGRKALWAIHCARAGAKKVYAVEANPRSFAASSTAVAESGFPQIELIHGFSDQISIPEKCEVLVHDLIGAIGSSEGMIPFLEDAKSRMLCQDAMHIPLRCSTYFYPSARPVQTFAERAFNYISRGFKRIDKMRTVLMFGHRPGSMLADPKLFEDLEFAKTMPLRSSHTVRFTVNKDGLWDALVFFIRLYVDDTHIIDSLQSRTNWYLPYLRPFQQPIEVKRGDTIEIDCSMFHENANPNYRVVCRLGRGKMLREVADHSWSGV